MLINSPNISGSLRVTGNIIATGSLTVGGTITGTVAGTTATASYVEYTNVANKPALVSSSAQVAAFGYATTGSNQFNGSQTITGSLTTTGTIVAQTLNVQQVTSSIVYSSGSNIFGNSVSNTQQFTGSVSVTGSLTVAGALNGTSATFTGDIRSNAIYRDYQGEALIQTSGSETQIGTSGASTPRSVKIFAGNSPSLTLASTGAATFSSSVTANSTINGYFGGITTGQTPATSGTTPVNPMLNLTNNRGIGMYFGGSYAGNYAQWIQVSDTGNLGVNYPLLLNPNGGNVGIGLNTPDSILEVRGSTSSPQFRISRSEQTNQGLTVQAGGGVTVFNSYDGTDTVFGSYTFNSTKGSTTSTRIRIDGSGNVGIGTTTISNGSVLNLFRTHSASNYVPQLTIQGIGNYNNMELGTFDQYDGYMATRGSDLRILAGLNNTTENRHIAFYTTFNGATGGAQNYERMRITSGGNVGIGTSSVQGLLDVYKSNSGGLGGHIILRNNGAAVGNEEAVIFIDGDINTVRAAISSTTEGAPYFGDIKFKTGLGTYSSLSTRMTITGEGNIRLFITPALDSKIEWYQTPTGNLVQGKIWTDGNPRFNVQVGGSGGVYLASGATSWTANSDETLKNINSIIGNAIDKLNTLRAVNFSWKSDTSNKENLGLIAQDVEAVFPQLVDTGKDGIMGVRYTELIPVLVKAIQELKAENDTLKSRIDTLEQA